MVLSQLKILTLAVSFLVLEGYINMSYNYKPNYENLVELIKQGGEAAVKASKQASESRGYMAPINVSMLDDKDTDDSNSTSVLNNRLYEKFLQIRENNEALKEKLSSVAFSKSSGVSVDSAYDTSFKLIDDLKSDYGMSTEVAAGFVGNLWHETGGFKYMQEIQPLVKGSKGGLGFAQWTGRRRNNFESYLEKEGKKNAASYEANYGFLKEELNTTEGRVLKKLEGVSNVIDATKIVSKNYLIPSKNYVKMDERIKAAKDILKRYNEQRSLTDEDN